MNTMPTYVKKANDFLVRYKDMRNEEKSEKEIADYFHLSIVKLRIEKQSASHLLRVYKRYKVKKLSD